jgi:hypothetical protein
MNAYQKYVLVFAMPLKIRFQQHVYVIFFVVEISFRVVITNLEFNLSFRFDFLNFLF